MCPKSVTALKCDPGQTFLISLACDQSEWEITPVTQQHRFTFANEMVGELKALKILQEPKYHQGS